MLPSSETRKTGRRKTADNPSTATLNSPPGIDHGSAIGSLSPVAHQEPTPPKLIPEPNTASKVETYCPIIEVRPARSPGIPLDPAMTIPRSTSDSLTRQPTMSAETP